MFICFSCAFLLLMCVFHLFSSCSGYPRDLHVLTHSFPSRRSSDLARSDLTNPRTRLSAELAWLPGVSPRKASLLVEGLLYDPFVARGGAGLPTLARSEEHTSELQSLMRISYAVFCLEKHTHHHQNLTTNTRNASICDKLMIT